MGGDLLGTAPVEQGIVRCFEGVGVVQVELVHPRAVFPVVALHRHPEVDHEPANPADHVLVHRGVGDAVAVQPRTQGPERVVALGPQALLVLPEQPNL